jgi:uncharacterized membrane protein
MKTWKPTVAGILSIIAGAFSLLVGLGAVIKAERAVRILFHWRVETIGILAIVLGIIAIVGGIFAIKRQVWGLALAGAICALFPPHVSVLGILAIVFVALSKDEFSTSATKSSSNQQSGS